MWLVHSTSMTLLDHMYAHVNKPGHYVFADSTYCHCLHFSTSYEPHLFILTEPYSLICNSYRGKIWENRKISFDLHALHHFYIICCNLPVLCLMPTCRSSHEHFGWHLGEIVSFWGLLSQSEQIWVIWGPMCPSDLTLHFLLHPWCHLNENSKFLEILSKPTGQIFEISHQAT